MYYAEEIINGILCYKTIPDEEWKEMTKEQLTSKIEELKNRMLALYQLQ